MVKLFRKVGAVFLRRLSVATTSPNIRQRMPRLKIIAAIGGNRLWEVAPLARRFGERVANTPSILMTGGDPAGYQSNVKDAALAGCADAGGLMISVLRKGNPRCDPVPGQRRCLLQTGLSSFGRDPITGGAADVVVVFQGGAGTLVELAYAALKRRPIVFYDSRDCLSRKLDQQKTKMEVLEGFSTSIKEYSLIEATQDDLMKALRKSLASKRGGTAVTSVEDAVAAALRAIAHVDVDGDTNFCGLPGCPGMKTKFESTINALSALGRGKVFPR